MPDVFRVYEEVGPDGYPAEWHRLTYDDLGIGVLTEREPGIKHLVRAEAGHRCVRCGHPYRNGEHGNGEWSPCDTRCTHAGPYRYRSPSEGEWHEGAFDIDGLVAPRLHAINGTLIEAQWRILTVHHLNGNKADCRWFNLAALCQRCHLRVQRVVVMERVWPWPHTDWFAPYAAGWYAHAYLGEDLTRDETMARLDELLALERVA